MNKNKRKLFNLVLRFFDLRVGGVFLGKGSLLSNNLYIGFGTRINGQIVIKGKGKVDIGKYCAIGHNVKIISSNHSMEYLNLQYEFQRKFFKSSIDASKTGVIIGNNVWIGDSVMILAGVKVGDGAVLAGGAVITKDVAPFSIVGGNPAKFIRYRFDESRLEVIKNLKWWDWSKEDRLSKKDLFLANINSLSLDQLKDIC